MFGEQSAVPTLTNSAKFILHTGRLLQTHDPDTNTTQGQQGAQLRHHYKTSVSWDYFYVAFRMQLTMVDIQPRITILRETAPAEMWFSGQASQCGLCLSLQMNPEEQKQKSVLLLSQEDKPRMRLFASCHQGTEGRKVDLQSGNRVLE